MKKVLIVESPGKTKTISKFLGKGFKVLSTVGHIKDLPPRKLGVSINDTVVIDYVTLPSKDKTIAQLVKESRNADAVYLALDHDREGEVIAWHLFEELKKVLDNERIHRITYNEITKSALQEALAHPSSVDLDKVAAQQARRVLDRLVGYEVSPILWKKISRGLSAGRVQSVALKLICDREEEVRKFKPEEYWSIDTLFGSPKGEIVAGLTHIKKKKIKLSSQEMADKAVKQIKAAAFVIESIKDSKRLKNPVAPFMTSTLQQAAYNRLGFSVSKTMQLSQKLYEGIPLADSATPVALITYMRTDSLRIADVAVSAVREYIKKEIGPDYLPARSQAYTKKKKGGQDAHEAIRPVDVSITPEMVSRFASRDLARLYELIWRRFVACQMKPAQYLQRAVVIQGGDLTLRQTASALLFDGFLRVYAPDKEEKDPAKTIPKEFAEGDELKVKETMPKQHFTQPPPRFTEGSLVKELEKEGIGRPSTYQSILRTIQARSYTELDDKKRFVPTELGITVTRMLNENLPKIMDVSFTANMEENLDKIARGSLDRDELIKGFYTNFEKDLEQFRGDEKKAIEDTGIACPTCQEGTLLIRFGKAGPFAGCSRFPECTFTSNFERQTDGSIKLVETERVKLLEEVCPHCDKQLRQVRGRYGPFIACSGYPACKYVAPVSLGIKCPSCTKGDLILRVWRGAKFWGCSAYPDCKFSVPQDVEMTPCPQCSWPFLQRKKDKQGVLSLVCANKACGYKETKPESNSAAEA